MSSKLIDHLSEVRVLPEITLEKLVDHLKDEALVVVCLIAILPFMQPIPIPGLSSLLGFITLMQGISLMCLRKPLLTKKMKGMKISHERFEKIFKVAQKFTHITDKLSVFNHPWTNSRASHFICGFAIVLSSAFLSLPLPIPMSNFVPALSIALICVGLLEEDIMLVIIGLGISVAVIWMGIFSYHLIAEKFPLFFYIN
ncbi:MAG: exopolysaccharide biosynthesis protein [Bdellovibrionales bacterium]|nr:exopolysaccharide biosynthesis protein [Bdellovibrionales bacterium]